MRRAPGVLAVLLLGIGCAAIGVPDRGEVVRRIVPSIVQLQVQREGDARRAASGVVLASDPKAGLSWIITTRHLLDPPARQEISVRTSTGKSSLRATVSSVSPDLDLAVLKVEGVALPPVQFKEVAHLGDEVWVVAFPWGRRLTVVSGVVSQIVADAGEAAIEGPARMVDASVTYGSSGGGVFEATSGALIGIVEGYRTARMAIPEAPGRVLQFPVPGETTVISTAVILRFLATSGLEAPIPK